MERKVLSLHDNIWLLMPILAAEPCHPREAGNASPISGQHLPFIQRVICQQVSQ
jgi:hypothetical protein